MTRPPSQRIVRALAVVASLVACTAPFDACRADDDGLAAVERGDCAAAATAINDGMARDDAQSYFLAGYLYAWTGCVTEDLPRAIRFYQRAAELGYADARNALGMMHGMGYGVPQDYRAAYRWFTFGKPKDAETAALDAAAETAFGYANTLTQVAGRRVVYPRTFGERPQGTLYVTVHTATGAIDYGAVGHDGAPNPKRLVPSQPFRAAIDRAYTQAFDLVPKPPDLGQDYVLETPWTFVLR